jgi:hypothetical protein
LHDHHAVEVERIGYLGAAARHQKGPGSYPGLDGDLCKC